jgi:hypothetical protein
MWHPELHAPTDIASGTDIVVERDGTFKEMKYGNIEKSNKEIQRGYINTEHCPPETKDDRSSFWTWGHFSLPSLSKCLQIIGILMVVCILIYMISTGFIFSSNEPVQNELRQRINEYNRV